MKIEIGSHPDGDTRKLIYRFISPFSSVSVSWRGKKKGGGRTSSFLFESFGRLVEVAEEEETLTDLGGFESFGHDVERDSFGDAKTFAIEIIRSLDVVASRDSTN